MALRVLLADESSTIKKVISLALQDFAVEVKVVQSGVDVIEVAKQFNPDIIFADVLLQKKNGYEVCFDVKNDPALTDIPVILMWSSFMDLDEKAFQKSKANAKLEKPFEVEDLRILVNTYALKTREQTASAYLKFPSSVTEPLKKEQTEKQSKAVSEDTFSRLGIPAPPQNSRVTGNVPPPSKSANWNMDSFDDIQAFSDQNENSASSLNKSLEDFSAIKLSPPPREVESTVIKDFNLSENDEAWEQKDLSKFKIEASEDEDPFTLMDLGKVELTQTKSQLKSTPPPTKTAPPPPKLTPASPKVAPPPPASSLTRFTAPEKETGSGSDSFQSFEFADTEALNLELDEVETPPKQVATNSAEGGDEWNFKLPEHEVSPIKPGDLVELPPEFSEADSPEDSMTNSHPFAGTQGKASNQSPPKPGVQSPPPPPQSLKKENVSQEAMIEKIVREQTREMVEKLILRILPDLAKQMIQKELDRLLSEENIT